MKVLVLGITQGSRTSLHYTCLESFATDRALFQGNVPLKDRESKPPVISGAFPRRIQLLCSPNVTSRDQCNEFSIPQWPRRYFASHVNNTGRLLIKNTTSCESLSRDIYRKNHTKSLKLNGG